LYDPPISAGWYAVLSVVFRLDLQTKNARAAMIATPARAPIAMPAMAPPLSPESLVVDDVAGAVEVVVASCASPVALVDVAVPDFDASAADLDAADAEEAAAAEAEDTDSTLDVYWGVSSDE
jgi:hypothetical protein